MPTIRSFFGCAGSHRIVGSASPGIATLILLILVTLVSLSGGFRNLSASEPATMTAYSVGTARQNITPDYPVRLNGFAFRKTESEGVSQPLWARALAIGTDEQQPIVLVTLDSLGVRSTLVDEVHRRLAKTSKLKRERLIVTFTHTHSAPKVAGAADNIFAESIPREHQASIDRYTEDLIVHLVDLIHASLADRQPATLGWALGEVGFAANRRTQGGPVDHSLPCLVVRSADDSNSIRAIYTTYACHCVTLSHNLVDGDWAGYAVEAIERRFPGAIAMVSIGCGADQNPDSGVVGDKVEIARRQGMQIGDEVSRLINEKRITPLSGPVSTSVGHLELPFHRIPTRQDYEVMQAAGGPAGYNATTQLSRMDHGETIPGSLPYPIQVCHFGDQLCMVFLSGEVCVDYALRLQSELDPSRLWMHGYSHDFGSYIASERLWQEGGYGAGAESPYFALPNKLAKGLEQKIIDEVHRLVPDRFNGAAFISEASPDDDVSKTDLTTPSRTHGIPPKSPIDSLRELKTHADLRVELVACEPQIADPVAIDFGPDGSVWVVQMSDYGHGIEEEFSPTGEVRVLKDDDGDGFYESSTVFVDKLRYPTDVKVWKDGALICDAPDIIFARDEDRDGRAETREVLFSGFETHNGQARVNSLRWGLDSWIYGSGGLFGGSISNQQGDVVDVSGRDFRIKPDDGLIEPVTGRSQQGRTRDDFDNWFGCDNSNLIRHYPVVDHYTQRNPFVVPPLTSLSVPAGKDSGKLYPAGDLVLFRLSGAPGRPTAACGIGIYRDHHLGHTYYNNSFTCEPVNQLVYRQVLQRQGATFRGHRAADEQNSEFLTSTDRWFRPVQARTGPDGGLWVVDMYRYVIEHPKWIPDETLAEVDVFAGQGKGRIYRVVPSEKAPRNQPILNHLDNQELAKAIDSDNGITRDLVHQMLLWRDARDASAILQSIAQASQNPAVRIQALAALDGLKLLSKETLILALTDSHPDVRRHAVRMSERSLDDPEITAKVLGCASDPSFEVRLQVAYSIALVPSADVTQVWTRLATESTDSYLESAALSSLTPANVGLIAEHILSNEEARLQIGPRVVATLAGIGNTSSIDFALKRILELETDLSDEEWQGWQLKSLATLLDGLDRRAAGDDGVLAEFSSVQQQSAGSLFQYAREQIRDTGISDSQAETALALLGRRLGPVSQRLLEPDGARNGTETPQEVTSQIAEMIDLTFSSDRQIAAVRAIARRGDPSGGNALLSRIDSATPQVRMTIIQSLIAQPDWDESTRAGLQSGVLRASDFSSDDRQRFIERQSTDLRVVAMEHLGDQTGSDREQLVTQWMDISRLPTDPDQGKVLFAKNCSVCHQFNGIGHHVGPDLSALTSLSTGFLLRAILNPNRDVDARYQKYTALMDDGTIVSGQIVSETTSSVTLMEQEAKQHVLLRNQFDQLQASGHSAMPEGLEETLTKQEMANIVSYVQGAGSEPHRVARELLDDSLPREQREASIAKWPQYSAEIITAMTLDMPAKMEEQYLRIPWIWRVAIAAGKRNESAELLRILDASLPQLQQPLTDWQAVVLGGGLINGISQSGDWPLDRVLRLISGNGGLVARWNQAISQASEMSDDARVHAGTRYDALRMIAIAPWATHGEQLASYLTDANAELQMGAVSGLSDMPAGEAGQAVLDALPDLTLRNRELALDALLRTVPRIERLLAAIENGDVNADWLGDDRIGRLQQHKNNAALSLEKK